METFDSTKRSLFEILRDVHRGKIQLPDFQRGWIWDDNRIKGILASVAKSFPIGAIMLLETGNENVRFKTKPVEGVKLDNDVKPDLLILDGQQRITSLYQTIVTNEIVTTRNEKNYEIKRWYYIDMVKAMDDNYDLEEAIHNKIFYYDFSYTTEILFSGGLEDYPSFHFDCQATDTRKTIFNNTSIFQLLFSIIIYNLAIS
jgi:uncharacterized protein with ParB-like and HNH nuclease domain